MSTLESTLARIGGADSHARKLATEHIKRLAMPDWALGRVLDLACDIAAMTGEINFSVNRKCLILMAADHGVVVEGVCPQPQSVTAQMVANFARGGAAINVLAATAGAALTVVDIGVAADLTRWSASVIDRKIAHGTANMAVTQAMSREEAIRAVEIGIEIAESLADECDVFALGEMGIGNTSCSTAVTAALTGLPISSLVGRGAGLEVSRLAHKAAVIERALAVNLPNSSDPLDVLAKVGGFELGGLVGVALAAAARRKPILVDGFITAAAALIAVRLSEKVNDFLIFSHVGVEPGLNAIAAELGKQPLLDLELRLGEGTGAALAMPLLDAAGALMTRMASFAAAGVTDEGIRK